MPIRKFPAGEQAYDPATYVGTYGTIFYNEDTGEFRRSDGVTPGGLPIPITIATSTQAGAVHPGPGFTVGAGGILNLNAGSMFELDGSNVFQLKAGTADRIGGIKAGEGVAIAPDGTLAINLDDVEAFSFGDFTATVGEYTDSTQYALLGSVKEDEDIVIASNGTGKVAVVGEFTVHATNGTVTGSLETDPIFKVSSDGQIKILVPDTDTTAGAVEIIGSLTGTTVSPGQAGAMLHITGQIGEQARFYLDGNGNYASIIGRRWNGSITAGLTQVLAGEDILRINATAATDAGMGNIAAAQMRFMAIEDHTTTAQGSQIDFVITPLGQSANNRVSGLTIKADGIELPRPDGTILFNGNTSGTIKLKPADIAGTNTITLPAATGTVVTTGDTGTVTNTMLAGSIANAKLANSTISGIALGSNLAALSAGNYLTGTDYNGGTARTFAVDATTAATAAGDLIVAWGSNRTNAASPTPAGWTSIATGTANPLGTGSDRSTRMVYQFTDGSAQTLTFDGGSADVSADPYSGCLIFRGASEVGTGAGVDSNSTGTTLTMPGLTINRVPATVIVFSFFGDSITAAPAGWTISNGMAYAEYLDAWAGGNFTLSATAALIGTTVEIY